MIWPRSQGCSLAILVLRHWYYSVLRKHGLTNVVANVWASVQCFSSGITFSYWNFCNKLKNRWLLVLVFINFFVSLMYSSWSCPKLFTIIVPLSTLVRNFIFPFYIGVHSQWKDLTQDKPKARFDNVCKHKACKSYFLWIKSPNGSSSTIWILDSYDAVYTTILFCYNALQKITN